jgi:hypothetical protein
MAITARKSLFLATLVAFCGVSLTPAIVTAQTTLPTITVTGRRPQSRADIDRFLDAVRDASLVTEVLEFVGIENEPEYPQRSLTLYTIDCRGLSQTDRTNAVTRALTIPLSMTAGDSVYLAFGTEVIVSYNGSGTERFVVTNGGGGGTPSSSLARDLTPVAGSLVCPS